MSEQDKAAQEAQAGARLDGESESGRGPIIPRPSRLALGLALVALLAVSVGLALGYHYWSDMKQSLEQLNRTLVMATRDQAVMGEHLTQTSQSMQQQQQKIAEQDRQLNEQRRQWAQERESLHQQEDQIKRTLSQVQQRIGGKVSLWQVAEAEYLMRLANQRLTLMGDPTTALAALVSADERLRATGEPGWERTREVLAQEMAALTALPKVDRAGLNARLSALLEQVDRLPLEEEGVRLQAERAALVAPVSEDAASGFNFRQVLEDLWQGFKSMMVIRQHDKPITAMLPPEQRYFLIQNLRLKLEGAKAALLGRNEAFYRDSLLSAGAWVKQYFAPAAPEVQSFLEQLDGLAREEIAPALPDVTASLRTLQEYREQLRKEGSE